MARAPDNQLIELGPFPRGANNIAREDSVPRGSFRKGVNVDVYPGGKTRRRKGETRVDSTPGKNLWSDGSYAVCTSLDGTTLRKFTPGQALVDLFNGFATDADLAFCSVNNLIYASDGVSAVGVDTMTDEVLPWGVPCPAGQPVLTAVDGGLDPGAYQVAAIYARANGEEGGVLTAASIALPNGGGIHVSMPAYPVSADIARVKIFVTPPGGAEFMLHADVAVGAVDFVIGGIKKGRPLYTMGLQPMPPSALAAMNGGRFVVAFENLVIYSEGQYYGLTDLEQNFYAYPGKVTMIAPVAPGAASAGLFVAAGQKTFFLSGVNMREASNQLAYNAGAVRGVPAYIHGSEFGIEGFPTAPLPMWLASDGVLCVGLPTGQVFPLTNGRFEMRTGDRVSIAQRELSGISQALISVRSPRGATVGVTRDSADSVLIRNGVVLP